MYNYLVGKYYKIINYKKKRYLQKLIDQGLKLGKNVSIMDNFFFDPSHCFLITIGDDCIFAPGVRLIAHDASTVLHLGYTKIGKITIGKRCFLGDGVAVLPGVTIGDGSIIGTGSIVIKDIPAGMVAAGNPAKVICSVEEYVSKVKKMSEGKKVFGREYFIGSLTNEMREEILQSVDDSIGFIV